jgi:DNA-binding winged helix-turn-helix (wHTH) protein
MAEIRAPARRPLRFGSFELDPESSELRKGGVTVSLQDQSLKVLVELLERPGDLVTREQLRQRLWPNGTFVDFEHGLNAVINRLRETLGDSADSPRFIQTVPRRGYRFIAPVGGAAETPNEQPVAPSVVVEQMPAGRSTRLSPVDRHRGGHRSRGGDASRRFHRAFPHNSFPNQRAGSDRAAHEVGPQRGMARIRSGRRAG